jgi:hypothetical protein
MRAIPVGAGVAVDAADADDALGGDAEATGAATVVGVAAPQDETRAPARMSATRITRGEDGPPGLRLTRYLDESLISADRR